MTAMRGKADEFNVIFSCQFDDFQRFMAHVTVENQQLSVISTWLHMLYEMLHPSQEDFLSNPTIVGNSQNAVDWCAFQPNVLHPFPRKN